MDSNLPMSGNLKAKLIRKSGTGKPVRQFRVPGIGRLWITRDQGEAIHPAGMFFQSRLFAEHLSAAGDLKKVYDLGSGLVTTAGVNLMGGDWSNANATLKIMNYHDSGTGTTAAAIGDTTLQTQAGPATRATGSQTNATANIYQSVGTINYVSSLAITEWGLFNQTAQGGTMWDHRVFAAINVVSGDSVQYTYKLTITAGG